MKERIEKERIQFLTSAATTDVKEGSDSGREGATGGSGGTLRSGRRRRRDAKEGRRRKD